MVRIVQLVHIKGNSKGGFDSRTECLRVSKGKNTRVVDFSLNKGSVVKVTLNRVPRKLNK